MKISRKHIILIVAVFLIGNIFTLYKYKNVAPYYQYDLTLKSKAFFYDRLQVLCKRVSVPLAEADKNPVNLSDSEKSSLKNISFTSYRGDEFYIFSAKVDAADSATGISVADKILNYLYNDSVLIDGYFAKEKTVQKLNEYYRKLIYESGNHSDTSSKQPGVSLGMYEAMTQNFLVNHFRDTKRLELVLPEIDASNITWQVPNFFRKFLFANILCAIVAVFILISFKKNE